MLALTNRRIAREVPRGSTGVRDYNEAGGPATGRFAGTQTRLIQKRLKNVYGAEHGSWPICRAIRKRGRSCPIRLRWIWGMSELSVTAESRLN